jgi:hypothetical protein
MFRKSNRIPGRRAEWAHPVRPARFPGEIADDKPSNGNPGEKIASGSHAVLLQREPAEGAGAEVSRIRFHSTPLDSIPRHPTRPFDRRRQQATAGCDPDRIRGGAITIDLGEAMTRVELTGWQSGLRRIQLNQILRQFGGLSTAEGRQAVERLMAGGRVIVECADDEAAGRFCELALLVGINSARPEPSISADVPVDPAPSAPAPVVKARSAPRPKPGRPKRS